MLKRITKCSLQRPFIKEAVTNLLQARFTQNFKFPSLLNFGPLAASCSTMTEGRIVCKNEMRRFMVRCMEAVGTPESQATDLADVLVEGDYRGHYSHGLNRLDMYVRDVKAGACNVKGFPKIVQETLSTACIDGANLLGPVVGNFCIDLAMEKARTTGIGWVVARGSNHYGIAGWYSIRACNQGLIGMSFTNTSPFVASTRGKKSMLGTNPISVAAPAKRGDSFVLDMATSCVAVGKVEMQGRKGEAIPEGWGIDQDGKVTTRSDDVMNGGALLPLGGTENTSGFKGYGLAIMVEIFCGILSSSLYGPNVRSWLTCSEPADLGQCFVAIDPNAFGTGFEDRMSDLLDTLRQQDPADGEAEVLVPGDPERRHMEKCDAQGGISYHKNQISYAIDLAEKLGVEPPKLS